MKDYKKEAKELLKDLKKWISTISDEDLESYIELILKGAYINGKVESYEKQTKRI